MDKNALSLVADIMYTVTDSEEWANRQANDPCINEAETLKENALEKAQAYLPRNVYMALSDAVTHIASAYSDAGIMYGMYVANALEKVIENPFALSGFYLDRMEANE